ncbi:MAG: anaerobic ribonucleoside-triphosphate reductase [Candidatus Margulisiibacteriota bacterium]
MTLDELNAWLERSSKVQWASDDAGNLYFRHEEYDGLEDKVKIEPKGLAQITVQQLEQILVGGRNIDHITRVTGYFSRVNGWNKGKRGELADRHRVSVG